MIHIISFGYGHADPPPATITVDLRHHLRDPHVDPAMREMTGLHYVVRANVFRQPGAGDLLAGLVDVRRSLRGDVTVAVGCVGGRHRSVVIACQLAKYLDDLDLPVTLLHRDIDKPVLAR